MVCQHNNNVTLYDHVTPPNDCGNDDGVSYD